VLRGDTGVRAAHRTRISGNGAASSKHGRLSAWSPSLPWVGKLSAVTQSGPAGAAVADETVSTDVAAVADETVSTDVAAVADEVPGQDAIRARSLSPSRAGDFLTCPLLYRFRVVDRLPEPPSPAAARGTLVHAVLERLFDHQAAGRTPEAARSLLKPEWERLTEAEPELTALFDSVEQRDVWLAEAAVMLDRYFTLEDPRRLEPAQREFHCEAVLESGLLLRGYIDRIDVAPGGEIRIVDYKTGTAPREEFEARALFQMRFYALVLWRSQGSVPKLLQLMYLGSGEIVSYAPDEADLRATERKVNALWQAIERARAAGDWRPRPSRLCDWCAHKAICPAFGGTPPPLPDPAAVPDPAAASGPLTAASGPIAGPAAADADDPPAT
jgi:putative RecB family exonuclease